MEKRAALVIGNSNYKFCGKLRNPVNDAKSVESVLVSLSFTVRKTCDVDQQNFNHEIDLFGSNSAEHFLNLFYYAGHGLQCNGSNYLVPIDANIKNELQIEAYCVSLNRIIQYFEKYSKGVGIVILDACRNNPFQSINYRAFPDRGLAYVSAPEGMVIAYSTAPGKTADDGDTSNGLYTEALVSQIAKPNISLMEIFQRVRLIVKEKSSGTQIPWESTSLTRNVYLKGEGRHIYGAQLLSIINYCNAINSRLVFYDKYSHDIFDESTEGGEITFYFSGDALHKISTRHFGEGGQMVSEYFLKDSKLCLLNECHIRYNRPFYYKESDAKEYGDTEWFDFTKSSFSTNKYYFDSGMFIVGYDNDDTEINLSDSEVASIHKHIERYQKIFKQRGLTSGGAD